MANEKASNVIDAGIVASVFEPETEFGFPIPCLPSRNAPNWTFIKLPTCWTDDCWIKAQIGRHHEIKKENKIMLIRDCFSNNGGS